MSQNLLEAELFAGLSIPEPKPQRKSRKAAPDAAAAGGSAFSSSGKEKKFVCTYDNCDYRAAESHHLVRHIRTHTGEKPFRCTECEYTAAEAGTLSRHLKTHGVDASKAHSCSESGCAFTSSSKMLLSKHIKAMHS